MQYGRALESVDDLQILSDELDIDEAALPLLDVPWAIGLDLTAHAPAHVENVQAKGSLLARLAQRLADGRSDGGAKILIPGNDAGTGERKLLPGPGGGA